MYAFLFNSQHSYFADEPFYGPACVSVVVQELEKLDPIPKTQIVRGDMTPWQLSYRISEIELGDNSGAPKSNYAQSSLSVKTDRISQEPDYELFKTVICDLAETLSSGTSDVSEERLLHCLGHSVVWAVSTPNINGNQAATVSSGLACFEAYLGLAVIDLGNPIHQRIMIESMHSDDVFLDEHGLVGYVEPGLAEEDKADRLGLIEWMGSSKPARVLEYEEFHKKLPRLIGEEELSKSGEISLERVLAKSKPTYREKIAGELLKISKDSSFEPKIHFTTQRDERIKEIEIDSRKFTEYLLKIDHPKGGPKAKFFVNELGIEPDDWAFLASQIEQGLATAPIYRTNPTEYGFSHGAYISVLGRNGRIAVLETGWMVESGKPTRFVTAYPADVNSTEEIEEARPLVVPQDLSGDDRWAAIFQRATEEGNIRASATQPTPMKLKGYSTIWDGLCGFAWIQLPNARHPMAKWMSKNDYGHKTRPGLKYFSSYETQSIDINRAFAQGFQAVLVANGIECTVGERLD